MATPHVEAPSNETSGYPADAEETVTLAACLDGRLERDLQNASRMPSIVLNTGNSSVSSILLRKHDR